MVFAARKGRWWPGVLSFLLHLILLALLSWQTPSVPAVATAETVSVEWIGEAQTTNESRTLAEPTTPSTKRSRVQTKVRNRISRLDLMPSWHPSLGLATVTTVVGVEEDHERLLIQNTWQQPAAYGRSLVDTDLSPYAGRNPFYEEIFRRLENELVFDSRLAEYGHFGRVTVYFAVTGDGRLRSETLRAETTDRILKVHVARTVRRALSQIFPERWRRTDRKIFWVAARFLFLQADSCGGLAGVRGPWFTLCRAYHLRVPKDDMLSELAQDVQPTMIQTDDPDTDPDIMAHPDLRPPTGVGLGIFYEDFFEDRHKTAIKKTGFDPFASWKLDPDWNL